MKMPEDKVTKYFLGKVKSVDPKTFTAEVVISDETKDRYDERVLVSSFTKTKKEFMKHPVLLSSHAYRGLMNQLGVFESIKIDNEAKEVIAKPKWFVGEGNPEADWGWKLAEKGVAAFSIGFIPKKSITYDEEARAKNGGIWRDFEEIELLEVSQVLIPANPSALQKSFGDTKDDLFLSELSAKIVEVFKSDKPEEILEEVKWEEPDITDKATDPPPEKKVDEVIVDEGKKIVNMNVTVNCDELKKVLEDFVGEFKEIKDTITEFKEFIATLKTEVKVDPPETKAEPEPEPEVKADPPETKEIEDTLGEEKMAELRSSLFGEQISGSNMKDLEVAFTKMTDEMKSLFSTQQ
jgi:hypothetical protein